MCFGLHRVCHWGPLTALGIIKIVTFMTVHCSKMLLPPTQTPSGFLSMVFFLSFSGLTLYNFFSAMLEGPGYLPLKWAPEYAGDERFLQFCTICKGYKAPRSHHCRQCERCVLKMDHHCPWINNCVGHANHCHFTMFLFFAACGCIQASVIMSYALYRAFNRAFYMYSSHVEVHFTVGSLIMTVFGVGLSIGVALSVGSLFFFQMRAILRNRTGIEDWILSKAIYRRLPSDPQFVYPYNLGWRNNFAQIFNLNFETVGDGINWPVVEGCNQYTLTIEQKEQKLEKRMRTRQYVVVKPFNGSWVPWRHGWKTCFSPPLSGESRIPLQPSETINVTRWRSFWLFGEKTEEDPKIGRKMRGWFPRSCVVEVNDAGQDDIPLMKRRDSFNKKNQ